MADLLVPFRPSPERTDAMTWVCGRAHEAGHVVVLGAGQAGPWVKADAVADALTRSSAEIVVVHDADVWTEGLEAAVAETARSGKWAVPHRMVRRLARDASTAVLSGLDGLHANLATEQRPYRGRAGGGVVVLRREDYERVPLDPRFQGWGQEDDAWALALRTILGVPWRGTADLYHLWHTPQERRDRRVGSMEGWRLYTRYRAAAGRRREMERILSEFTGASVA